MMAAMIGGVGLLLLLVFAVLILGFFALVKFLRGSR